ncbi:hypothetical protein LC612_38005 [Nostoc sp. CHAB 5834]|nr:hypothetical protein [Nostoc sp. CHAB 5834]
MASRNKLTNKNRTIAGLENLRSPLCPNLLKKRQFIMMTQSLAPAPTKDPLITRDRQIIATIVNESDYSKNCKPEDVVTIWINSDDIVWVKMTHGYARYHKECFKRAVAEVKESLSTPVECNHQEDKELKQAAEKIGLLGNTLAKKRSSLAFAEIAQHKTMLDY